MSLTAKTALLSAALALAVAVNQADAYVKTNLAVQPLSATSDAQDLMLHADNNGSTFLYLEQQQGAMLSVYDVTHPGSIKLEASVPTGAHKSFDFLSAMGDNELIEVAENSRTSSDADLMVTTTLEATAHMAFLGPINDRYERVPRRELPDRLVLAVESRYQERIGHG